MICISRTSAGRIRKNRCNGIRAIRRTFWPATLDVRRDNVRCHGIRIDFVILNGPLILAAIDLAQVIDAGILTRELVRALANDGIAIAAKRPMIATTIMISTSVKPCFFIFFIFFLLMALADTTIATAQPKI